MNTFNELMSGVTKNITHDCGLLMTHAEGFGSNPKPEKESDKKQLHNLVLLEADKTVSDDTWAFVPNGSL